MADGVRMPRWLSWLIAALGIGVLVVVVARADIDGADFEPTAAAIAILLSTQVAYLVTESVRLQVVLERAAGRRFRFGHMLRVFVLSRILNLVVPQSGNVYRIAAIRDRYGAAITETAGGMVSFVWLSVTASLGLAAVLAAFGSEPPGAPPWWAIGLLAVATLVGPWLAANVAGRIHSDRSWVDRIARLARAAVSILGDRAALGLFVASWLMSIAVISAMYGAAFAIVGEVPPLPTLVTIYALVQATSFIVITPGNIGIQDLGFAAVAVLFGVPAGPAAGAALVVRLSGVLVTVIAGVIAAGFSRRDTAP